MEHRISIFVRLLEHLGFVSAGTTGTRRVRDAALIRQPLLDAAFLKLASESFSDWNALEADTAFRHL
jgi:hypothetical protein